MDDLEFQLWYEQKHKRQVEWEKEYYVKARDEALTHYGKGKLACVRCGYTDVRALSIDHIDGRGHEHRKLIKGYIGRWLKKNNYPEGYQTLCMNCQWIKKHENKEY